MKKLLSVGTGILMVALLLLAGCMFEEPGRENNNADENQTQEEQADPETELEYTDVKKGSGTEAKVGDTVEVHYVGTYKTGEQFDSSRDRGETFSFTIGNGEVIQGWEQGIPGMKVGGTRELIVPSNLGYQDGKTMNFEVELISVNGEK